MNLNEDPQLSQHIYYAMKEFPVKIGRKNDQPKPQIIFGGISVHKNHGEFQMLDNGLIQLVLTSDSAYDQTLINGKHLSKSEQAQVLHH
mmetsp:Transcript_2220/g.3346  ORF Transcript_2220/g.3346 Transcript_2220/m.3346 type:complete len:89 (+) Transcript_2220:1376-1642(+)